MKCKNIMTLFLMFTLLNGIIISGCAHEKSNISSSASSETGGGIKGKVGIPLNGTFVYVYKDKDQIFGPGFAVSEGSAGDGSFSIDNLPPGKYYIVARKRQNGEKGGVLTKGDYRSDVYGPIEVKQGEYIDEYISCYMKMDSSIATNMITQKTKTGISGIIKDSDGKPISGIRVHVYTFIQMSERPKYVSDKTGPDGKFVIYLPEGGTYYLSARDKFGGPPSIGELYGRYDGGDINPTAVIVKDGEMVENININVHKVW